MNFGALDNVISIYELLDMLHFCYKVVNMSIK